jgi:hypothetical protein
MTGYREAGTDRELDRSAGRGDRQAPNLRDNEITARGLSKLALQQICGHPLPRHSQGARGQ